MSPEGGRGEEGSGQPQERSRRRVRGVVFDIDGTLVDSNDAHARAWVEALGESGFHVPFGRVRDLIGMGGDRIVPILTGLREDDPGGRRIAERAGAIFEERYLPTLRAFPDVRALVERMRNDGLVLVVATSAREDEVSALLGVAGVRDLFDATASKGDAPSSKPAPGIVEAAAGRAGLPPERLLMIGDTPYDIAAAARAGVRSIAFRSGGWPDDRLTGAIAIYDGAWDLLGRYDEFVRLLE